MKTGDTEKSEVLVIRLSKETKTKLQELSKDIRFGNNNSAVVRYLIENASKSRF